MGTLVSDPNSPLDANGNFTTPNANGDSVSIKLFSEPYKPQPPMAPPQVPFTDASLQGKTTPVARLDHVHGQAVELVPGNIDGAVIKIESVRYNSVLTRGGASVASQPWPNELTLEDLEELGLRKLAPDEPIRGSDFEWRVTKRGFGTLAPHTSAYSNTYRPVRLCHGVKEGELWRHLDLGETIALGDRWFTEKGMQRYCTALGERLGLQQLMYLDRFIRRVTPHHLTDDELGQLRLTIARLTSDPYAAARWRQQELGVESARIDRAFKQLALARREPTPYEPRIQVQHPDAEDL